MLTERPRAGALIRIASSARAPAAAVAARSPGSQRASRSVLGPGSRRKAPTVGALVAARARRMSAPQPLLLYAAEVTRLVRTAPRSAPRGPGRDAQPLHEYAADLAARCSPMPLTPVAPASAAACRISSTCSGVVVDPRHQRRDQHARRDPRPVELADGLQPRPRVGRVRLARPPRLLVDRRDRQVRADLRDRARSPS